MAHTGQDPEALLLFRSFNPHGRTYLRLHTEAAAPLPLL